jgi:hypothetical protein
METQKTPSPCCCHTSNDEQEIPKDVAERFGITGFRTKKFENDDEDSSLVDRCSASPAVMEAFEVFHNAAISCKSNKWRSRQKVNLHQFKSFNTPFIV